MASDAPMTLSNEDLVKRLREVAARGVEVTVFTNARPETPPLRFKWTHNVHRDCAISTYRAAGFELRAVDCDGDSSYWTLKRGKTKLAEGEDWGWNPYHFDACLLAAETALIDAARTTLSRIRGTE